MPTGTGPLAQFPAGRPRRLRRTAALRSLVAQTRVSPGDLVLPLFVKEGLAEPAPISSMPGVVQHSRDSLRKAAVDAVLLTSGSTARNLLDLLGPPPAGTLVCCIGPSTAAEAARAGLHVDAVAEQQTPAGLVTALAGVLAARAAHRPVRPADPRHPR